MPLQATNTTRAEQTQALTQSMVHRYYCENDVEYLISLMDDDIIWLGTGEQEFAVGWSTVSQIFRTFSGQVPQCNISQEEYHVRELSPDAYLCSGRMWIETDASTQIALRVHQRITTLFRWTPQGPRCCHIHISNPYGEMMEEDVGFPTHMARQSYEYLQEQVMAHKQQFQEQTEVLRRLSYEDALTGVLNRNKFNQIMQQPAAAAPSQLGIACFDLNGLKQINDQHGHGAGDNLLRQAAELLQGVFQHQVFRTGGDEFVVVNTSLSQHDFYETIHAVQQSMTEHGISCSVGISWRDSHCNPQEQLDEADRRMYEAKRRFYGLSENNRRHPNS